MNEIFTLGELIFADLSDEIIKVYIFHGFVVHNIFNGFSQFIFVTIFK